MKWNAASSSSACALCLRLFFGVASFFNCRSASNMSIFLSIVSIRLTDQRMLDPKGRWNIDFTPPQTLVRGRTDLAKELWISLTNSKLAIASPRITGLKSVVKSLNACRWSPSSRPETLLTIFRRATLAQASFTVCDNQWQGSWDGIRYHWLDWQTKRYRDISLFVRLYFLHAICKERSSRK